MELPRFLPLLRFMGATPTRAAMGFSLSVPSSGSSPRSVMATIGPVHGAVRSNVMAPRPSGAWSIARAISNVSIVTGTGTGWFYAVITTHAQHAALKHDGRFVTLTDQGFASRDAQRSSLLDEKARATVNSTVFACRSFMTPSFRRF